MLGAILILITHMPEISDDELQRLRGFESETKSLRTQLTEAQKQAAQLPTLQQQLEQANAQTQTLTEQNQQLQGTNSSLRLSNQFEKSLNAAGVLPQYANLFDSKVSNLKLEGDAVLTQDGKTLDAYTAELKTQYPGMFAADNNPTGGGAPAAGGSGSSSETRVVQSTDLGAISGLDPQDILNGNVTIAL